jgi:thymidine kinase
MSIKLLLGPMFSGKTERLIALYNSTSHGLAVKPTIDNRYSASAITSHSGKQIPALVYPRLNDVVAAVVEQGINTLFVDEGQFFPDLADTSIVLADSLKINVVIAALNGDVARNPWSQVQALISHVTEIEWLANDGCSQCHKEKICFTMRTAPLPPGGGVIDVGGHDKYTSVCRKCHHHYQ